MEKTNRLAGVSRIIFITLSWIYMICVVIQTLFAGIAVFNNYEYWNYHTTFVIWFQFIPVIMLFLAFTAKLPGNIKIATTCLFLLVVPLQYISVNIPILGAIHPVVPLILFWLILSIIKQATQLEMGQKRMKNIH